MQDDHNTYDDGSHQNISAIARILLYHMRVQVEADGIFVGIGTATSDAVGR